jgi:hypothetical protein
VALQGVAAAACHAASNTSSLQCMETSCCVHVLSKMPAVSDSGHRKGCQSAWQAATRREDSVQGATEKIQSRCGKQLRMHTNSEEHPAVTVGCQLKFDADPCTSRTTYWTPVEATHTRRLEQCSACSTCMQHAMQQHALQKRTLSPAAEQKPSGKCNPLPNSDTTPQT